jgi:hypothetical protein
VKNPTRRAALKATLNQDWGAYGIEPKYWSKIKDLCLAIAGHYPRAYPGQKTLAGELGWSVRTVKRYTGMAVAAGILAVKPNSGRSRGHGEFATNTYLLWYLHRGPQMAPGPGATGGPQSDTPKGVSPEGKKETSFPSSRRLELAKPPAVSQEENSEAVAMVGKWKDDPDNPENWMREQAIGEPDEPKAGAVLKLDPAVRLSRHFERQWKDVVLQRKREYRGVGWGDRGPSVGYLRGQMLDHLNYDHVESMIDTFTVAFCDDEVALRDGQTAWQCFVGWWGKAEVPDPAIKRADREYYERGMAAYRKMQSEG